MKPLFQSAFPGCWTHYTVCNKTWIQAIDYLEICGIIVGQILVGIIGDWLGRRWGLIQDATIMFVGLLMLTASWGVTLSMFDLTPKLNSNSLTNKLQTAGSSATSGLSSSTVSVWVVSTR